LILKREDQLFTVQYACGVVHREAPRAHESLYTPTKVAGTMDVDAARPHASHPLGVARLRQPSAVAAPREGQRAHTLNRVLLGSSSLN